MADLNDPNDKVVYLRQPEKTGVLPDSRTTGPPKGVVRGTHALNAAPMYWVPIFCASCGGPGGYVPEENMMFAFYLCQPCADKYGAIANTMMVPDEVFWQRVAEVQLEKYGRILGEDELIKILDEANHPFAALVRDKQSNNGKGG